MAGGVVIIGAGQAGAQVAISLRERGRAGPITIVGDEPHIPYQRPPLSKAYLKEALAPDRLQLRPRSFYDDRGIELALGGRVGGLDVKGRRVLLLCGKELAFDDLVLATGTRPRLPNLPGITLGNVFALRSMADVDVLRPAVAGLRRIAILGAGYIGLEVAAVLRRLGKSVIVIEAEARPLKRVTSLPVSRYFSELHRRHGVDLLTNARVTALLGEDTIAAVALGDGTTIAVDAALLAIGAVPNSEIANAAGIAVDDGILVDAFGRTTAPRIYACGDCARFPSRRYDRSVRIESVQNAIDQAKAVAASIAGEPAAHDPVPWFWSDQYDTKLQIAGLFHPSDEVSVKGDPASGPFAVEYRRGGRLVAVDAVDNARAHMLARRRIAEETAA